MKSKRPTLRDVAREANISYQTVSRVINGNTHVSPETRSRVLKAINTLGFRPNRAAQILQTERSHTIEVVVFYSGFNLFVYEMARTSQQLGYHFIISAITEQEFVSTLDSASSRFVDGLILVPMTPLRHDYEALLKLSRGTPFVQIGAKLGATIPSVIYDQVQGGRLATQHLIDLGHQRLAEISGPLHNHDGHDRHISWLATLRDSGLPPGPSVEGDFTIESGHELMHRLLDEGADFTGVVVGNDSMALGAYTALRERGLRVPEDISIVGFDDIPESAHLVPRLTTVRQDFHLLGRLAVEYVVSMIENPDTPVHQRVLQPSLIVRDSTSFPRDEVRVVHTRRARARA
jgi:DNA-binding LacI/PurR family transcriptional regulator